MGVGCSIAAVLRSVEPFDQKGYKLRVEDAENPLACCLPALDAILRDAVE